MKELSEIAARLDKLVQHVESNIYSADNNRGFLLDKAANYTSLLKLQKVKFARKLLVDEKAWEQMAKLNEER